MELLATRPGCCAGLRAAAEESLKGYEATIGRAYAARRLLSGLAKATDEEVMMSRKHCHARHVSSIVMAKWRSGTLVRVFLTWPGHTLANNRPGSLTVGIHDHRYPVVLYPIHGDVINAGYKRSKGGGIKVDEWGFRSGVVSGKPELNHLGIATLWQVSRFTILGGVTIWEDEFHTIECDGCCAWEVIEGVTIKDETTLFTDPGAGVSTEGLYEKFADRREVVRHVEEWIGIAGLDK